jgi:spectinomycin phosphotransferase
LKLKKGPVNPASLETPRFLRDQGIAQVVAPLAGVDGRLMQPLGAHTLILYPWIEGRDAMSGGLTEAQWVAFGRLMKQIHAVNSTVSLPPHLLEILPRETFHPPWAGMTRRLEERIQSGVFPHPAQAELAAFWLPRSAEIGRIVARAEELGRALRGMQLDFVICHSDAHTANLLVDSAGDLALVDWDGVQLAPKERDLMFVAGDREAPLFFRGYGETALDPLALAYYAYEWVVQEIGDFGERVFFSSDGGDATRSESVRGFEALFQPGDVVEAAYRSDEEIA